MIEISCKQCGDPCPKPKTQSKKNYLENRKFCTAWCYWEFKVLENRKKWAEKKCKTCGKGLDKIYLTVYCSKECQRIEIPEDELRTATTFIGGKAQLARKYNISPAAITHRLKKLLTRI